MLKFIDLFCGIGGFHQAIKKLNYNSKCVIAVDIDKKCRESYKKNYSIEPHDDIKKVDEKTIPDFDILCAGFPCQPFSNGGNKKCFSDNRGLLFDEIIRIAEYKKPKFMFLENVKHIIKVSDGEVMKYIKKRIKKIGYKLQIENMSPHNYGIPQQRERVFFICIRNDIYNNKKIKISHKKFNIQIDDIIKDNSDTKYKIKKEIEDVLDAWDELIKKFQVGEKISPTILIHDYYRKYTKKEIENLPKWKQDYMAKNKPLIKKYIKIINPWYKKYKNLLQKREIYGKLEWQTGIIKKNDSIYNYFIQFRQSGIRVKRNKYFPTLVAISQIPIYGKTKSYITPRECARLQSLPEDFILDENDRVSYKQMGNSVNVENVYAIINSTLKKYKTP
jgi:DNA (cytosine-5)-methyltransferase 1